MTTDKPTYSMADIGPAMRLTRDRLMVIPEADVIGKLMFAERICATAIDLKWDQWAKCTITCFHGKFSGTSDFLNLTEAVLRASERFRNAEHPRYCMADYVAVDEDGLEYPTDCTLWADHEGAHGEQADDD